MKNTEKGQNAETPTAKPHRNACVRFIRHIEREFHQRKAKQQKEPTADRMARRTANATVWIAVFTVLLACAAGLTLYEVIAGGNDTHELAVQAKRQADAFNTSQRAFLSVSGIDAGVQFLTPDDKTVVSREALVNWINDGTTPAKRATAEISEKVLPAGAPYDFVYHDLGTTEPPTGIGPKQTASIPIKIPINDIRVAREDSQSRVFVWGWIVYNDAFPGDPPRLTEFCRRMFHSFIVPGKDIADPSSNLNWNWIACPNHNCYDEDCPDYEARIAAARGK